MFTSVKTSTTVRRIASQHIVILYEVSRSVKRNSVFIETQRIRRLAADNVGTQRAGRVPDTTKPAQAQALVVLQAVRYLVRKLC